MTESKKKEILSDFIDDLNKERKPRAYRASQVDEETEKLFETVRALRRTQRKGEEGKGTKNSQVTKGGGRTGSNRQQVESPLAWRLKKAALVAGAALLILVAFLGVLDTEYFPQQNIVHGVVKAYEDLESYAGTAEIRSRRNGEVDYQETIEITYQKPWRYKAVHHFDGREVKNISDGERLVSVYPHDITVDNVFPEKELWRYHIGNQVWELKGAEEVKEVGEESILGRQALVLEYRYRDYDYRMWIDKKTNLPLKKELTRHDGTSSLVVEFKDIEINPQVDPELFTHEGVKPGEDIFILEQEQEYEEINRRGSLEEVNTPFNLEKLKESLPSSYDLFAVGILEENPFFRYVLRFRGEQEMDFLDVYLSSSPREGAFFSASQLGKLGEGYVEVNRGAPNVMDLYVGDRSIARWVTPEFEAFLVANQGSDLPLKLLEKVSGEEMEDATLSQLKKESVEFPAEKEGP
ncbi:MAG: DUF2092 domain-containing protein [Candidatus Syntrophonatronum acetioxidans]|uniref:DUF2092 domain-containing protein n=1 Tax=Candidatus Syntrophonatronum acetioxidans TaxID=1795816 RepID=A0A424YEU5_9FIRM|nr:MAG: DUF2092 domain-containing protein [Candidatus Syntrophonatronum acetioxidans]